MKTRELLNELEKMNNVEFADYLYDEFQVEGTSDGLYFENEDVEFNVNFSNDDIKEFLGLDENMSNEELADEYQLNDERVDKHFIVAQRSEIMDQLEEIAENEEF